LNVHRLHQTSYIVALKNSSIILAVNGMLRGVTEISNSKIIKK
jgi:hypothetical protein